MSLLAEFLCNYCAPIVNHSSCICPEFCRQNCFTMVGVHGNFCRPIVSSNQAGDCLQSATWFVLDCVEPKVVQGSLFVAACATTHGLTQSATVVAACGSSFLHGLLICTAVAADDSLLHVALLLEQKCTGSIVQRYCCNSMCIIMSPWLIGLHCCCG